MVLLGLLKELCFQEQLILRRTSKLSESPKVVTVKSCTGACQAFRWSCCPRCCCSGWTPRCPRSPRSPAPPDAAAASRTGSPDSSTCVLGLRLRFSSTLVEGSSQLQSLGRVGMRGEMVNIGLTHIHWLLVASASSCPQRQLKKAWVPLLAQCTGISPPPSPAPVTTPPSEERKLPLPSSSPGQSPFRPRTAQQTASTCPSPPCSPPGKVSTKKCLPNLAADTWNRFKDTWIAVCHSRTPSGRRSSRLSCPSLRYQICESELGLVWPFWFGSLRRTWEGRR